MMADTLPKILAYIRASEGEKQQDLGMFIQEEKFVGWKSKRLNEWMNNCSKVQQLQVNMFSKIYS